MEVFRATIEDLQGWLTLAAEVEYLFGPMVSDPNFQKGLEKNINRGSAFCVREKNGKPGTRLLGGVLFSSARAPQYNIGWLAVSSAARKKGVASRLLEHCMSLAEPPAEISVVTFGEEVPDGHPARLLYQKYGFVPLPETLPPGPEGGSRQKFTKAIRDSVM
ncbi:GNAT family N-acetyltransferase [Brevibacillus nitrificans]|uniref:GNAT family N-acetyltransferase n=1 Tax=Brevibacillus nitrificans TaxID=651560 RepID=UPI00262BDD37|nr:GNAT family N-acetyltransferase [Brevibacillus nitrificans]